MVQIESNVDPFQQSKFETGMLSKPGVKLAPPAPPGCWWRCSSPGTRAPSTTGSCDWSTHINHNTIVYQYWLCTQCRCVVPAHFRATHAVIRCRPITRAGCMRRPITRALPGTLRRSRMRRTRLRGVVPQAPEIPASIPSYQGSI